ncbi:TlpA disulfide reductase family protein [Chitinophaga polysaccharea]|uniref:TlpA disulfide reductase family protein n=1 Tax=Chitinophaga polysaccharea TaxID=1293035 RepID=UPI00115A9AC3|nr:TlpA disulfide reductase family protein [Chitinophaga polysaccharea]
MRSLIVFLLILTQQKISAQQNVYTFNNGVLFTEAEVKASFDAVKKTIPPSLSLTAVIYHKTFEKDTVVNYITFAADKKVSGEQSPGFKMLYKQDSLFLLLNKKLPDFNLEELDGNKISSARLLGKPTLINFWAIYCGPCIAEMPQLSMLKEKYKDKMNFVAITENSAADDNLTDFLKDKKFNFQILENGEMYKKEIKIRALPTNLFLDKNGILRFIQGNYPLNGSSVPLDVNDKENYFTRIIEDLIKREN